jgi:hypothetical protein
MPDGRFFQFLDRAFAAMRDEVPHAYEAFTRRLAPLNLALEVDRELRWLVSEASPRLLRTSSARVDAELRTTQPVIRQLIEGELMLLDAIRSDALFIRGSTQNVAAAYEALISFFAGAARAPSVPCLLDAYLEGV